MGNKAAISEAFIQWYVGSYIWISLDSEQIEEMFSKFRPS